MCVYSVSRLAAMAVLVSLSMVAPLSADQAPSIPLQTGLTFVTAVQRSADYESFTTVDSVSQQGTTYSVYYVENGRRRAMTRIVTKTDGLAAHKRQITYPEGGRESYPGTTGPEVSAAILNDLKTRGSTQFTVVEAGSVLGMVTMTLEASGTIYRVEPNDVPQTVIVNDVATKLPAVHARGELSGQLRDVTCDMYILDDTAFPLVLAHTEEGNTGRVVKINYHVAAAAHSLETRLATTGRAAVYGIYFDFDSAEVREQSTPGLQEITDALNKNSGWKLAIEGHTDNLGGDPYNLDLSKRRAEAVKVILVTRYHIDAARLTTVGYGASRPKASNDTLEGRAQNRRVELVRQ
jgi:outer membrane protein OmpA-like peptidoglycan-associated protein